MKEDIQIPKVNNVTLAVVRKINQQNAVEWSVYLINNNKYQLENTLVASTGYGNKNGQEQKTSTLRHFLDTVEPNTSVLIEPILPDLFHLNNQYWVSYYLKGQLFDKKYIFVPESIKEENLMYIKELKMEGILHS